MGEPFTAKNAYSWPVDKKDLHFSVFKAMVGQAFASGCAQPPANSNNKTTRVLMIGLGGAAIPNFLGEIQGMVRFKQNFPSLFFG